MYLCILNKHDKSIFSPVEDFDGSELSDQVSALLYVLLLMTS